ncbi:hypothetical protein [Magnetofaba australis]|uniref:hypothetical protein n=1 Tax=Magnetofaba australis TaxID=1472297 RepID=UPI001301BD93|nr:hypothetical protein [Magnetofaba australis]
MDKQNSFQRLVAIGVVGGMILLVVSDVYDYGKDLLFHKDQPAMTYNVNSST